MCLQDQRMAATAQPKWTTITPAAGTARLPDLSKALWFYIVDNFQASVNVFFDAQGGNAAYLPRDARMTMFNGAFPVYTREMCGAAFLGPMMIGAVGGVTYSIGWLEMDDDTYQAIQDTTQRVV